MRLRVVCNTAAILSQPQCVNVMTSVWSMLMTFDQSFKPAYSIKRQQGFIILKQII